MPQLTQLTTDLPPPPEPAWKTAHELRLTWTAPMGGAITIKASYTVPPAVFDKISRDYGFSSDVRSRLFVLLVEGQEFRPPATWRSKQIREYFNNRIHAFSPGNVRAAAAGLELQAAAAAQIAENNARIAAAREAQERAAQEALVAVAQAAAIAVVSEPSATIAETDIPF